ncbi:MAG: P-II family nitrogen regulator [Alphaproteobacteria bacterium]|nr:P-II family nitrogen regulator [Alphaproteobacteria bacterium]
MKFKLIVVMVADEKTDAIIEAARTTGATGCTVITSARGEGLKPQKTFLGLSLEGQRDVVLLLVEEHLSRHILETLGEVGRFDEEPGTGVAFQIDLEDAVGLTSQIETIEREIEDQI